jgi:hypothetical protein
VSTHSLSPSRCAHTEDSAPRLPSLPCWGSDGLAVGTSVPLTLTFTPALPKGCAVRFDVIAAGGNSGQASITAPAGRVIGGAGGVIVVTGQAPTDPASHARGAGTLNIVGTLIDNGVDTGVHCTVGFSFIVVPNILLNEVSYAGGNIIRRDKGTDRYDAPHWKDNSSPPNGNNTDPGDRYYPYLYQAGEVLTVSVKWVVDPPFAPGTSLSPLVRGTGPDGINIPETAAAFTGGTIFIGLVSATAAFAGRTKYYHPFEIAWEISFDDGYNWCPAGVSDNAIYVALEVPSGATPFHTVVHLACSNDGATTAADALVKTWQLFALPGGGPANVVGWNDTTKSWTRRLHYYRPRTTFGQNPWPDTDDLLNSPLDTGQCSTWANLFADAIALNGSSSSHVTAQSIRHSFFLVKNWRFAAPAMLGNWRFQFGGFSFDMADPVRVVFGELTNRPTIAGQNSAPVAPSQKVFSNHQFVRCIDAAGTATYYDPSYGVTYADEADFQAKAVAGFAFFAGFMKGRRTLFVFKPTASLDIRFT